MTLIPRPADPGWRPTPESELAHLRLCWGLLYQIGYDELSGEWVMRHWSSGEQFRADNPLELRRMIRADWNEREQGKRGWTCS